MHALLPPVTMRRAWRVGEQSTQHATRVRQTSGDANNETLSAALHSRLPVGRRLVQVPRPFLALTSGGPYFPDIADTSARFRFLRAAS